MTTEAQARQEERDTDPAPPLCAVCEQSHDGWCGPPDSSPLDPMRSGAQNEYEESFHGCMCSLVETDNTDDDVLRWYVSVRDDLDHEEIQVEKARGRDEWRAYGAPDRFHRAALSFVRSRVDWSEY